VVAAALGDRLRGDPSLPFLGEAMETLAEVAKAMREQFISVYGKAAAAQLDSCRRYDALMATQRKGESDGK